MTPPRRRTAAAAAPGVSWRDVEPAPLILITGKEGYLIARAVDRLRALLRQSRGAIELSRVDASSYGPGQLQVLASPSLFEDPKLIVVEDLAQMSEDLLKDALEYVGQPDPEVVVVFVHSGGNRGKKLLDALKAKAVVVDAAPYTMISPATAARVLMMVRSLHFRCQRRIAPVRSAATKNITLKVRRTNTSGESDPRIV